MNTIYIILHSVVAAFIIFRIYSITDTKAPFQTFRIFILRICHLLIIRILWFFLVLFRCCYIVGKYFPPVNFPVMAYEFEANCKLSESFAAS